MAVTLQDVAELAGVSRIAASYALRDRKNISLSTRQRVKEAAAELGYLPNAAARSIRNRETGVVGVLVANHHAPGLMVSHPSLYETILGINHALDARDYVSALLPFSDVAKGKPRLPRVFRERMLDAMIVLGAMPEDVHESVRQIVNNIVWADGLVWKKSGCIRRDERRAGELAVERAALAGYRRVVFLHSRHDMGHYSVPERLDGASASAGRRGVTLETLDFSELRSNAWHDLRAYLSPDTAVLAAAYHAQWLVSQSSFHSLKPGVDFGLGCVEANEMLRRAAPQVSRADFDRYAFGQRVGEMALAALDSSADACPSVIVPVTWHDGITLRQAADSTQADAQAS